MKPQEVKVGMRVIVNISDNIYHDIAGDVEEIFPTSYNGGRNICVVLDRFGRRYFSPEYLIQVGETTEPTPAKEPEFTKAMLADHFEEFLNTLCINDPTGWENTDEVIMAREAIASSRKSE